MAQGPVAALPSTSMHIMAFESSAGLSEEEKHQIRECERIIKFRDAVLSGAHPTIKVPAHLVATKKSIESSSPPNGPSASLVGVPTGPKAARAKYSGPVHSPQLVSNLRSFNANSQHDVTPASNTTSGQIPGLEPSFGSSSSMTGVPTGPRATAMTAKRPSENLGNVQFDPVLLTKSDDLIKAELSLQRRRLEGALSEQLQQHKATRNSQSAEAPADFDLANVLMEALLRVQRSALPQTDANLAANVLGAASDAVSDDTFYSSKHDTPESHQAHRIPDSVESVDAQAREGSHYEPPMVIGASPVPGQPSAVAIPPPAVTSASTVQTQQYRTLQAAAPELRNATTYPYEGQWRSGLGNSRNTDAGPMEIVSSQDSGEASSSQDSGQADGGQPFAHRHPVTATQQLMDRGFGRRQSPILRVHNLSPVAPQPAHVSLLATPHQPPVPQQNAPPAQATPAQVAALRNDRSNGSSPESSPQGGKPSKKGKKKNKRKADRMATNTEPTPYIKPEPRSPSPISVPQYSRPNKRLRQVQQPAQDQGYEDPRVEEPVEVIPQHGYPQRVYREERGHPGYDSPIRQHTRPDSRPIVLTEPSRYERDPRDDLRSAESIQYVRRGSLGAQPYQYAPSEVRTIRSVSRAGIDRPHPYYDSRDPPRTVIRHVADRDRSRSPIMVEDRTPNAMGPPRLPRTRVVHVDEFGREYLDPAPRPEAVITRRSVVPRPVYDDREEYYDIPRSATVVRRSVAPASAYGEPEFVYERAPPPVRAASTMPSSSRYDEEAIYRGAASPLGYATTRRVVTRPVDYAVPEYRYYHERDYQAVPPPGQAGDEYYEVRRVEDRMPGNELPREYRVRGTTVRPEPAARPNMIRMASVRPEPAAGEYAAPIVLDDRQAMPPPRAYSVRPMANPQHPQQQQQQYARQWPEYETRGYGEPMEEASEGLSYMDSAPRDVYR
ncbi:hypothetical protein VSDG_02536 [Cytospora chrysosperma]|uniref:Uncharacterized protein n=1 Tax=Cytospora chrysosperma TaxID=252740 RepID=A0A423WFL3_CYTCH|nr:hypothetical protein VSDG_02536 [Valsa sordida]